MPSRKPKIRNDPEIRNPSLSPEEQLAAIANLQALGFKITPPTTGEEIEKHKASQEKLGLKAKPSKPKKQEAEKLKAYLGTTHMIADKTYGPGLIELPPEKLSLFRTLLHQDMLARKGYQDTKHYQPYSRCYLIRPGNGQDQHNKFSKLEVSEAVFNAMDNLDATIQAGAMDVAGYNPSFNPNTRQF